MSDNRDRLIITPGGPWRIYTHPLAGWEMLGTVQRAMEMGAIGRSPAGILAQINAGAVRAIDQRKARAALEAANDQRQV